MVQIDSFIINPETKNIGEVISRPSAILISQFLQFNPQEIHSRIGDEPWVVIWKGNLRTAKRVTVRAEDYDKQIQAIEMDMLNIAIWYKKQRDAAATNTVDQGTTHRPEVKAKKHRTRPGKSNRLQAKNGQAKGKVDADHDGATGGHDAGAGIPD